MKLTSMVRTSLTTLTAVLATSQIAFAAASLQSQDPKLKPRATKESCANADRSPRDSVAKISPPSSVEAVQISQTKDGQIVQ